MSTPDTAAPRTLRRDRSNGAVAGVCAGIAKQAGIDVLIVRIVFIALVFAGGFGIALYALLWALLPDEGQPGRTFAGPRLHGRGAIQVALGAGLLMLSLLLTLRALDVWVSDLIVWPVVLVAVGGALLWRESGARAALPDDEAAVPDEEPVVTASRTGIGVALVIAAGIAFLSAAGALSAARNVLLAVFVVAVVLGVIFGPWIVRLARSLTEERAERIRTISSTGVGAAPVTESRRLDRSCASRAGWLRIVWYRVGGPGSTVTRSRGTRASTWSASNTACGSTVAPIISDASQPALYPKAWKKGLTIR